MIFRPCIGCNQGCCGRALLLGKPIGCLVNAETGRELELGPITPAKEAKRVLVIGGGPAGMEAARVAALRGHRVVLYEKSGSLGGQVNTLIKAPNRQEFGNGVAWLGRQVEKLGVEVKLNSEIAPGRLPDAVDAVVVATGSVPDVPDIPGASSGGPRIVTVFDVLEGRVAIEAGQRVVLLDEDGTFKAGGTAEFLADRGADVHVVTGAGTVGRDLHMVSQVPLARRLREKGVQCSSRTVNQKSRWEYCRTGRRL